MPTIRQKQSTYAIAILTFQGHRHFQRTANAELFIDTLFQHRDKGRFQLHAFVVMPDHTHILITPATDQSTARCVQYVKGGYSFAARQRTLKEIWHSGYHEHRIRDTDDFNNQFLYIQNNPSRKTLRGLPTRPHKIPGPPRPHPKPSVSVAATSHSRTTPVANYAVSSLQRIFALRTKKFYIFENY